MEIAFIVFTILALSLPLLCMSVQVRRDKFGRPIVGETKYRLLWVDIETTGLDPEKCAPLEIGMFMTDTLLTMVSPPTVFVINPGEYYLHRMNEFVREMHKKSGLAELVRTEANPLSVPQADARCYAYIRENRGDATDLVLAGSGCHFDDLWLTKWFPLVKGELHYRHVNVSMFKVLLGKDATSPAHRSLADLEYSVGLLREVMATYRAGLKHVSVLESKPDPLERSLGHIQE